jgi:hypothetical protein
VESEAPLLAQAGADRLSELLDGEMREEQPAYEGLADIGHP